MYLEGPPTGKGTNPLQSRNCDQRCHIRRETRETGRFTLRFININAFYNV
jgi:hypothetical protein